MIDEITPLAGLIIGFFLYPIIKYVVMAVLDKAVGSVEVQANNELDNKDWRNE